MQVRRKIYCCECGKEISARLTNGNEVYPHRSDLKKIPFWKCDICKNFVGCHYKTSDRTKPLGCIPNNEIKQLRKHIHFQLDPLWKNGFIKRHTLYNRISKLIGYKYHTAELRTVKQAAKVLTIIKTIRDGIKC